jgi:hypothetical protein
MRADCRMLRGAVAAAIVFLTVSSAAAVTTDLDFVISPNHPAAASISYAGGVGALTGSGINIGSIVGIGGPTIACTGCALSFSTGAGVPGVWAWSGGGPIVITGTTDAASGVLLSGTIGSAIVSSLGPFKVELSAYVNTVNADLAAFFGLVGGPTEQWAGYLNLSFMTPATFGNAFVVGGSSILSGDAVTYPTAVPEPASLLLVGTGVIGLIGSRLVSRRRSPHPLASTTTAGL